jgi:hypothetical protein
MPRIFVSIASFRDAECQWTLRDLFVKSAHPERVFVGVVWQIDPVADAGYVRMAGGNRTAQYLPQVGAEVPLPCWAVCLCAALVQHTCATTAMLRTFVSLVCSISSSML